MNAYVQFFEGKKRKVELSLYQTMEAHGVVRGQ
jgi:hypothetical protein